MSDTKSIFCKVVGATIDKFSALLGVVLYYYEITAYQGYLAIIVLTL